MKRILGVTAFVIALAIIVASGLVILPYASEGPGPAQEVVPLIQVQGRQTFDTGKLVMTSVSISELTAMGMLRAWIDPNLKVVSRDSVFGTGTVQQEQQRAISQMDQSKIDAAFVVLSKLAGYPKKHGNGA